MYNHKPKRVFVSHSSRDRDAVELHIVSLFKNHEIETWYSEEDIQTAEDWKRVIVSGLKSCDWFVVALSPRSTASEWVSAEVDWAFEHRPDRLIPVIIEECDTDECNLKLRNIQCLDFTTVHAHEQSRLLQMWGIQVPKPSGNAVKKLSVPRSTIAEIAPERTESGGGRASGPRNTLADLIGATCVEHTLDSDCGPSGAGGSYVTRPPKLRAAVVRVHTNSGRRNLCRSYAHAPPLDLFNMLSLRLRPESPLITFASVAIAAPLPKESTLNNEIDELLIRKTRGDFDVVLVAVSSAFHSLDTAPLFALSSTMVDSSLEVAGVVEDASTGAEMDRLLVNPPTQTTDVIELSPLRSRIGRGERLRIAVGVKFLDRDGPAVGQDVMKPYCGSRGGIDAISRSADLFDGTVLYPGLVACFAHMLPEEVERCNKITCPTLGLRL